MMRLWLGAHLRFAVNLAASSIASLLQSSESEVKGKALLLLVLIARVSKQVCFLFCIYCFNKIKNRLYFQDSTGTWQAFLNDQQRTNQTAYMEE